MIGRYKLYNPNSLCVLSDLWRSGRLNQRVTNLTKTYIEGYAF